jgi:dTDP-4-dehydrorhamnose reductase
MKILVLGSNGMAGHVLVKYLSIHHDVTTVARSNADYCLDIENKQQVENFLTELQSKNFDFVINCIGLLVQDSIQRPDRATIINSWFPHAIAHSLSNLQTKLIHLSTDCVFDGSKGDYFEEDVHTETNYYGKSKSLGEINNDKDVTFRMSIIGPEIKETGTGLFHWFVNKSENEVGGYSNAMWNGLTTLQLAKCIDEYISDPTLTGIIHVVNNEVSISKYDLLVKINEIFELGKIVNKTVGPKTVNKILVNTKKDFNIPNYDIQLNELKDFIK